MPAACCTCTTAPAPPRRGCPKAPTATPAATPTCFCRSGPPPAWGDNHAPFFQPEFADGVIAADLRFAGAERFPGKYSLPGLPAFRNGEGAETLRVTLRDDLGLTVTLLYGVLPDCDLITRAAIVENTGSAPVTLRGVPSAVLDFARHDLDLITFDGAWAAERTPHRAAVRPGVQGVGSVGGIPTHVHNPFVVLCAPNADETRGGCWGAALVYSGNYRCQVEKRGRRYPVEPGHRAVPLCLDAGPRREVHRPGSGLCVQRRRFWRHEPEFPQRHPAASDPAPLGRPRRAPPGAAEQLGGLLFRL